MSRLHFLKLVEETARKRTRAFAAGRVARSEASSRRDVAIVDDNFIVLHAWKRRLPTGRAHVYSSPGEFWSAVADGLLDPGTLLCVVSDLSFDAYADTHTPEAEGWTFLEALSERFDVPVFLQTNHEFDAAMRARLGVRLGVRLLEKRPYGMEELEALVASWHK
jgi:hypothetical protein